MQSTPLMFQHFPPSPKQNSTGREETCGKLRKVFFPPCVFITIASALITMGLSALLSSSAHVFSAFLPPAGSGPETVSFMHSKQFVINNHIVLLWTSIEMQKTERLGAQMPIWLLFCFHEMTYLILQQISCWWKGSEWWRDFAQQLVMKPGTPEEILSLICGEEGNLDLAAPLCLACAGPSRCLCRKHPWHHRYIHKKALYEKPVENND